ncbi:hypothetical protein Hgul01_04874 [Herpetosiphon gulosus]|uniref:Twin-arginine translocation signal domain-containing protein n=1 Tax=Herpetosiphon gulosus TaxID=1973496 RepID=A0ABP9X6P5_9CHLR
MDSTANSTASVLGRRDFLKLLCVLAVALETTTVEEVYSHSVPPKHQRGSGYGAGRYGRGKYGKSPPLERVFIPHVTK